MNTRPFSVLAVALITLIRGGYGVAVGQVPLEPDPAPAEVALRFSGEYPNQFETGVVLVTFRRGVSAEEGGEALALVAAHRAEVVTAELPDLALVRVADGTEDLAVERLREDPRVLWVRKNWARYLTGASAGAVKGFGGGQQMPYNVAHSNAPVLWQIVEPGEADGQSGEAESGWPCWIRGTRLTLTCPCRSPRTTQPAPPRWSRTTTGMARWSGVLRWHGTTGRALSGLRRVPSW
jgi:hypothetical protein